MEINMANFLRIEYLCFIMFFVSFYGLITCTNIFRSVVFIILMEMSVIMFIISIGFVPGTGMSPPIGASLENVSDPLPQALTITAIVIGLAVSAVNLTMLISLYRQYKATDWDVLKRKKSG